MSASSRRVEALVGTDAFRQLAAERALVNELSSNLKTPRDQLVPRIQELSSELKQAQKRIQEYEAAALSKRVPEIAEQATRIGELLVATASVGSVGTVDDLRSLVGQVRARFGSDAAVVALAGVVNDKPMVVVGTNEAARDLGTKAGPLAKAAASTLGGGGGGKPDMAQGGGSDVSKIAEALSVVREGLAA